jgi:hypothetical protein
MNRADAEVHFWSFIRAGVGDIEGCWEWGAGVNKKGYGEFSVRIDGVRRNYRAHRWSYESFVRPIPAGLHIDHLCHNRSCVNPWHLEPVTHQENTRRGLGQVAQTSRTHCKNGHEYTEENTLRRPARSGNRVRQCKVCTRAVAREYKADRRKRGLPA